MASVFGFDESTTDMEVLVNSAAGINGVYENSANMIMNRAREIATAKGLAVTGRGVSGIQKQLDGNGFKVGWITRPHLHLYFHEIGTYKDPSRPHLRPAVDELEEQIYNKIQDKIGGN